MDIYPVKQAILRRCLPRSGDLGQTCRCSSGCGITRGETIMPSPEFKGSIKLDVRDSVPDWSAFTAKRPPDGSPNVLVVLYDDTGMASWSTYGGRVNMPTLDKLAANG